ncbi:MAG: putative glycoside hydrolase [Bryobacteraceae bacterium]
MRSALLVTVIGCMVLGSAQAEQKPAHHGLYVHPYDVTRTDEGVRQLIDNCRRANIDTIVLLVKGMSGELYYPSRQFAEAVVKGYDTFDLPRHVLDEGHRAGIKVQMWLCDFVEGENSVAYKKHPEWAQLNPSGGTTATERLGPDRLPYPYVWMCPARRPGYVDQWLLPMFVEIATQYRPDAMHHDYVRYGGDVAPDSYCFCDYCLRDLPRWALLSYNSRADERYRVNSSQERIEANWWSDPTMLPAGWKDEDRREKADFLLNGRTIPGGPPDLRYFFYEYRATRIENWVREAYQRIKQVDPHIEMSASVFKNPIQSGRFIGQKWSEWTDWMDTFMPMTYRSHFAGSFESYLDHLTETTARQLEWIGRRKPLYAGVATTYLYREEYKPLDEIATAVRELQAGSPHRAELVAAIEESAREIEQRLRPIAPARAAVLAQAVRDLKSSPGDAGRVEAVSKFQTGLRNDFPPGYLPPSKLSRAIEAAQRANPDGVVIFAYGTLKREKLMPALERAFGGK